MLDSSHTDLRSSRSQPRNEFPARIPVVRVPFFGQSFVRGTHAAVSDIISLLHSFLHGRLRLPDRVARDHQELLFGQRNIACLLKSSQATQLVVCGACKAPRPKSFFDKQNLFSLGLSEIPSVWDSIDPLTICNVGNLDPQFGTAGCEWGATVEKRG